MKKLSVLVTMLALSCVVLAAPVGRQQARQKAVAFLKQQNFVAQISEKAPIRAKSAAVTVDQSPYYIFNLDGNKGFIIVSGDDRAEEILGYADEGSFDAENIPDGLQALLDQYAMQRTFPTVCRHFLTNMRQRSVTLTTANCSTMQLRRPARRWQSREVPLNLSAHAVGHRRVLSMT